jgi:hypothetical protein
VGVRSALTVSTLRSTPMSTEARSTPGRLHDELFTSAVGIHQRHRRTGPSALLANSCQVHCSSSRKGSVRIIIIASLRPELRPTRDEDLPGGDRGCRKRRARHRRHRSLWSWSAPIRPCCMRSSRRLWPRTSRPLRLVTGSHAVSPVRPQGSRSAPRGPVWITGVPRIPRTRRVACVGSVPLRPSRLLREPEDRDEGQVMVPIAWGFPPCYTMVMAYSGLSPLQARSCE